MTVYETVQIPCSSIRCFLSTQSVIDRASTDYQQSHLLLWWICFFDFSRSKYALLYFKRSYQNSYRPQSSFTTLRSCTSPLHLLAKFTPLCICSSLLHFSYPNPIKIFRFYLPITFSLKTTLRLTTAFQTLSVLVTTHILHRHFFSITSSLRLFSFNISQGSVWYATVGTNIISYNPVFTPKLAI